MTPLRRAVLGLLVDDASTLDPEQARRLVEGGRSARDLTTATRISFADGLAEDAAGVAAPIAAIWGDRDRMVPAADAEILLRAVPSAVIRFLPGCGHLPMVERPEAFAALLAELAVV